MDFAEAAAEMVVRITRLRNWVDKDQTGCYYKFIMEYLNMQIQVLTSHIPLQLLKLYPRITVTYFCRFPRKWKLDAAIFPGSLCANRLATPPPSSETPLSDAASSFCSVSRFDGGGRIIT